MNTAMAIEEATLQTAPPLTKEEELDCGIKIQNKLSAEAANEFEMMNPAMVLENKDDREKILRGMRGMDPKHRSAFSAEMAQKFNDSSVERLMDWAPAYEFFSEEDSTNLQAGWDQKKAKSFEGAMKRAGRVMSSKVDAPGIHISQRAQIIRIGDRAATDLVKANILLVHSAAHEFEKKMGKIIEYNEFVAQGMIGLWKAVLKYDPERGNKFSTVAYSWIRQSITREVNNTYRLVRLPENRVGDFIELSRYRRSLSDEDITDSEFEALAMEKFSLTREKIREIMNAASTHASLNKKVGTEDGEKELHHFVAKSAPAAETHAIENQMQTILDMALSDLSEVELEVVVSSFKLDYGTIEHRTVKAICADRDITPSQYRRISAGAMAKIKEHIDSYGVTFTDFFN